LKKLNLLILKSFVGPFVATFFISMFLFLMHFLWKYIDEFVGKGLEWTTVAKLLFYAMADLIPFALPLAVLLSSLMTYGNLAETFELVAIKSAGISLFRVLMPSFLVMILLAFIAFYISNIIIPTATLEFKALLWDVRNKKPAFNIQEGIFYNEIQNYSIKVSKKEKDGQTIRNVIIYENKNENPQLTITRAEWGTMKLTQNKRILLFTLYNGIRYEEMTENVNYFKTYPHNTFKFKKQEMAFDLTQLDLKKTEKDLFKGHYKLMNVVELNQEIDSLNKEFVKKKEQYVSYTRPYFSLYSARKAHLDSITYLDKKDIIQNFETENRVNLLSSAQASIRNLKSLLEVNQNTFKELESEERKYRVELHKKYTLSSVLLVLFLLAAPLGTIIRKGGLGLPMVVSILMFVFYYVVNMVGDKMAREGVVPVWVGAWLATFALLPIAIWILKKASDDAPLFEMDRFAHIKDKLWTILKKINAKKQTA
jgi:lipopolysaccharide export system permease protein